MSRQLAHEGGMVVSPTHRAPLSPGNIPGTYFCWRLLLRDIYEFFIGCIHLLQMSADIQRLNLLERDALL
jgi:hypothetical protein